MLTDAPPPRGSFGGGQRLDFKARLAGLEAHPPYVDFLTQSLCLHALTVLEVTMLVRILQIS